MREVEITPATSTNQEEEETLEASFIDENYIEELYRRT